MSQIEINNSAKSELEDIINELFLLKLESKLNENVVYFEKKTDNDRKAITRNINDFKEEFQNKSKDLPNLIKKVSTEIKNQSDEVKQFTKDGLESIPYKISEINEKNSEKILSEVSKNFSEQKNNIEELYLILNDFLKFQTGKIISNNSDNIELFQKSQAELKSEIVALIKGNECDQKKNIQDLDKSIADFIELGNQNNLNLQKQLDSKFASVEKMKSALIRDFDDKFNVLKTENEQQVSQANNKSNISFKVLIIGNILILVLLLLNYFFLIS